VIQAQAKKYLNAVISKKGLKMLALNIDNQEIENFYKQECNSDQSAFIDTMLQYIKIYKIKTSVKQGIKEIKEMRSGKREEQELKSFLDEL